MRRVKLKEIAEINPRKSEIDKDKVELVSFVAMADVSEDGIISEHETKPLSEVYKGYTYFRKDDVLLAKITPCFENGKAAIADNIPNEIGFGSSEFHVLRTNGEVIPSFLFYALWNKNFRLTGSKKMTGSAGQKRVPTDFLKNYEIPLPSLSEQKAIVAKLDRAQRLIDIDKEMLVKYDDLIQSVFLEMFGDLVGNPKGWRKLKLKDFCEFENGDRSSNYPSGDDIKESGKLFLSSGDIQNGKFTVKDSKFISNEKFDSLKRGKCKTGDVLVTLRGSGTGKTAVFDCHYDEGFINAQMVILRPDSKCLSEYLVRQLNCPPVFKRLINLNSGSAQPQLSATSLKKFEVLVPNIEIQKQYERKARQIEGEKEQIKTSLKKSEELFSSLVQGAFG